MRKKQAAPVAEDLGQVPEQSLNEMYAAGRVVRRVREELHRRGSNVVAEMLHDQGAFYEYNHYPEGDVFDPTTGSQYYYHAHRGEHAEHGHFHTFLRRPRVLGGPPMPTHLVALSMDQFGEPAALFTVNRWVTDETWTPAETLIRLLPGFAVRLIGAHACTNEWITAVVRLFQPEIEALLRHRDGFISREAARRDRAMVLEDRKIEVIGRLPIDLDARIAALAARLGHDR